jgi:hypothetical protein
MAAAPVRRVEFGVPRRPARPRAAPASRGPEVATSQNEVSQGEVDLPAISASTVKLAIAPDDHTENLRTGIKDALSEVCAISAKNAEWHSKRAAFWGRLNIAFGLPAVILAALAGATALASTAGRVPAAIIAFAAAIFTGASSWLNSRGQRAYHQQMSSAWVLLANQAKLHLLVDADDGNWISSSGREVLRELLSRQAQLYEGKAAVVELKNSSARDR